MQSYFSPTLVKAITGQSQASAEQIDVAEGQSLAVSVAGASASPTAQQDTAAFGYVTDSLGSNSVTLARPLAVAETYGGQNGVNAIVRICQDSGDTDSLRFYRVDDLDGTSEGIAPGQQVYAVAVANRAYSSPGGAQSVDESRRGTSAVSPGQNAAPLAVTGIVLPAGASVQTSESQAADLSGTEATFAGLQVDTTAPIVQAANLKVSANSGATSIGLSASDNETAAA